MEHIVWISGMPRSGTTWLSQIFASSPDVRLKFCPLFSYEFKNALTEQSTAEDWRELFAAVYTKKSEYLDQHYLRRDGLVPEFKDKNQFPSHLVIKSTRFHHLTEKILTLNPDLRFIHIVRDPRASIYSWISNPYEFPSDADVNVEWKTGRCRKQGVGEFWGFDDWYDTTKQALEMQIKFKERFVVVKYEELKSSPLKTIEQLFSFSGLEVTEQTRDFIRLSQSRTAHNSNKRSVYKDPQKVESWRSALDRNIANTIAAQVKKSELSQFLDG